MGLPNPRGPDSSEVTLADGSVVTVRGLTRQQIHEIGKHDGPDGEWEVEALIMSWVFDATLEEAEDYLRASGNSDPMLVKQEVMRLSGMGEDGDRPT